MKKNRQQEIEELQKRVFGKDRSVNKSLEEMISVQKEIESFEKELKKDFSLPEKEIPLYSMQESIDSMNVAINRANVNGNSVSILNTICIYGPQGCGKHTLVEKMIGSTWIDGSLYTNSEDEKNLIQDLYQAILSSKKGIAFENLNLIHPSIRNKINQFFKEGVYPLNKRYIQNKNQLQETSSSFVSQAISKIEVKNKYLIYLSNESKEKILEKMGRQFIESINDFIECKPLDETAIDLLIEDEISLLRKKYRFTFDESLKEYYKKQYDSKRNAYSLKDTTDGISKILNQKILLSKKEEGYIHYDTDLKLDNEFLIKTTEEENPALIKMQKELDEIVGLDSVKEYVKSLENLILVQKLREKQGLKVDSISKHMIFLGNPGTGKTTVARILSRYLQAMGVLKNGHLIEVTRQDLVGKYAGHTAPLTQSVIESALGGILFIDEAYSLHRSKEDSFGLECIDTLVKGIEEYKDQFIVILAGYEKEMKEFLSSNSGLESRFPNVVHFEDYTPLQLVQICHSIARKKDYYLHEECDEVLKAYFEKTDCSGNGRMARNLVEKAILHQAGRIVKENGNLQELRISDFELGDVYGKCN